MLDPSRMLPSYNEELASLEFSAGELLSDEFLFPVERLEGEEDLKFLKNDVFFEPESWQQASEDLLPDNEEEGDEEEEGDFEEENIPPYLKDDFIKEAVKQMNSMSIKEIEEGLFNVHGISKPVEEEAEMVTKALEEMNFEIRKLKLRKPGQAYCLAEDQSTAYVCDRAFRIMFLRSTSFRAQEAARLMMGFFESKLELWGEDKLGRNITLDDFSADDLEAMENGHFQLLSTRDHAGRSIIFNNLNRLLFKEAENQFRVFWYMAMTALEDEETQKRGLVYVQYKVGKQMGRGPYRTILWKGVLLHRTLPVKLGAAHACFNKFNMRAFRIAKYGLEKVVGARLRMHEGTHSESLDILATFGIQREAMPLTIDGELIRDFHLDWLKRRRLHEKKGKDEIAGCVIVPSRFDVLLGRGKRSQTQPGNLRLNYRLEQSLARYNETKRGHKVEIVVEIMDTIKSDGGRFLMRSTDGTWAVVDDEVIRNKINHDFRTIRNRLKGASKETGDDSRGVKNDVRNKSSNSLGGATDITITKRARKK